MKPQKTLFGIDVKEALEKITQQESEKVTEEKTPGQVKEGMPSQVPSTQSTNQSGYASQLNLGKLADRSKYKTMEKFESAAYENLAKLFGVNPIPFIPHYKRKSVPFTLDEIANKLVEHGLIDQQNAKNEAQDLLKREEMHSAYFNYVWEAYVTPTGETKYELKESCYYGE